MTLTIPPIHSLSRQPQSEKRLVPRSMSRPYVQPLLSVEGFHTARQLPLLSGKGFHTASLCGVHGCACAAPVGGVGGRCGGV